MKPTQGAVQRIVCTTANQKSQLLQHRLVDGLKELGISISETADKPGTLRCKMPEDHQVFVLPLLRHYKSEILVELRGEPAYTIGTYDRFMGLSRVKCTECQHHHRGGEQADGQYRS